MSARALDELARVALHPLLIVGLLVACVLIRLPAVDDPLFGRYDIRWNQTASIARNFYENGMNIFYPQIDWGGSGAGFIQEGFQLYSYLVAILYSAFGVSEAIGRGLSLTFYALSALLVYALARRLLGSRVAVWALFFVAVSPMGVYYGASFQPDILILLCSILAVYLFVLWTDGGRGWLLFASAAALTAAGLMKPHSLFLALPLAYLCYRRFSWRLVREGRLWLYALIVIVPIVIWYAHADGIWRAYGNSAGIYGQNFPMMGNIAMWTDPGLYRTFIGYLANLLTAPGVLLFVVGLMLRPPAGNYLVHWWTAGFAISALASAGVSGSHEYYVLPLLPAAAMAIAVAADVAVRAWSAHVTLPPVAAATSLAIGLCLVVGWQSYDLTRAMYLSPPRDPAPHLAYARRVQELTDPRSLLVFGSPGGIIGQVTNHREPDGRYMGDDPIEFYHSHRKGWSMFPSQWSIELVDHLRRQGARYFATSQIGELEARPDFQRALDQSYALLERTPQWAIYRLDPPAEESRAG